MKEFQGSAFRELAPRFSPFHSLARLMQTLSLSSRLGGVKGDQMAMAQRMFELTEAGIIQKLVANYDSPFPNASHLCLNILAFYSSFLRVNFCKDNILQFSQVLLDKLEAWSKREDVSAQERDLASECTRISAGLRQRPHQRSPCLVSPLRSRTEG